MRLFLIGTALLAAGSVWAIGAAVSSVRHNNLMMGEMIDTCVIQVKTAFLEMRLSRPGAPIDHAKCVADGKDAAKTAYADVVALMPGKKATTELMEWRLEWMAAFDAAMPKDDDTQGGYLRRVGEARQKVDRATNKLEIAVEP